MTQSRFEQVASTWDESPLRKAMADSITDALCSSINLDPHYSVMDYGAGTGLISLEIASKVQHVIAMDSSPGMLKVLQDKINHFHIENVSIVVADLEKENLSDHFDLIFSSMTMHHISDPIKLLGKFSQALNPGGILAIADLDTESGNFHPDNTGVKHFGFDRDRWQKELMKMGLKDVQTRTAYTLEKETKLAQKESFSVFLITAQKP